jgi:hypothetical protein
MVNPAPVRVARKSTMNSPLVKAANKIVTSPTFAKARSIDFDKKNEYDKFIKFIESSNKELLRIKLPSKENVAKEGAAGGGQDGDKGRRFGILDLLGGYFGGSLFAKLLSAIRKRLMKSRFVPKFIKRLLTRMKRLWRNFTKPLRQLRRFITSIPGKIKAKLTGLTDNVVKFFRKNIDDAVKSLKNLKNAKWIKNLTSKIVSKSDDVAKVGKEFITNSKVLKTGKEITEQVVKKAGPKISSAAIGELTVIGGIATDLSMAAYRLEKGDNTGALLSTLAAVPILGIPFNVVDVARDLGAFEDGGILDKIDFLDWFRLNKDNPNYVDKRTDEQKEIDEDLDAYLKKEYEKDIKQQLKDIEGRKGKSFKGTRNRLEGELALLDGLTSTQLRTKTKYLVEDDLKLFRKDASSHEDIKKFLDNIEKSESISTESFFSENVTTLIDNSQIFLLPDSNASKSMFTEGLSVPPINITNTMIDFDYSKANSGFTDELLFLKLDK